MITLLSKIVQKKLLRPTATRLGGRAWGSIIFKKSIFNLKIIIFRKYIENLKILNKKNIFYKSYFLNYIYIRYHMLLFLTIYFNMV